MDTSCGLSALWYRTSKPVGKVRQRVRELCVLRTRWGAAAHDPNPNPDLSHSESQRLAVDGLINDGTEGYLRALSDEGEVDFLSDQEKRYVLTNKRDRNTDETCPAGDEVYKEDEEIRSFRTRRRAVSTCSDASSQGLDCGAIDGVKWDNVTLGESSAEVFFRSDERKGSMKDLVREFIRKAQRALAVAVDAFSDVELLCDVLEASRKRNVSVHLLLDHRNLDLFLDMCQEHNVDSKHFPVGPSSPSWGP